ncbi:NADH dehydrogenase alpha subcomplex subunit 8 [Crepidotus variabilis]|uniref:NADH-ubiquinone oxidoreductase n=1 Tax=Crepidotus variabilis TaxID=179855 RepID=A0A9P6EFT8_9AGAR|nr:NADH dehydrogenase alpha subcomplex subunit 8 [Crepidotus variabilis]
MTTQYPRGTGFKCDFVDQTPMPADVPHVDELGVTSAPLKSAAFFLGSFCKDYNEDFMLCKSESRDPAHCLKEGRKVTRCAIDLINKMRENCGSEWDAHWECLDKRNQELYHCRQPERKLNECMFDKLGIKKVIPGTPEGRTPIHEKQSPIYKSIQK